MLHPGVVLVLAVSHLPIRIDARVSVRVRARVRVRVMARVRVRVRLRCLCRPLLGVGRNCERARTGLRVVLKGLWGRSEDRMEWEC